MPVITVFAIFNGEFEIDETRLQEIVIENLSDEEIAKLQFVEDTMHDIEIEMANAGFSARVKEAQVLYVLALSDFASEEGFVAKLVGCFAEGQTDEQLIAEINAIFGIEIIASEFSDVMETIRAVYIDTSSYMNPE